MQSLKRHAPYTMPARMWGTAERLPRAATRFSANCVANNCEDAEGVQYSLKLADRETGSYVVQMKPKKGGDFDYAKLQRLAEELNAMLTTCGKQALAGAKEAEAEVREALGTGSAIPELSAVSSVVSVQVGC